jgi:hypothetical protein
MLLTKQVYVYVHHLSCCACVSTHLTTHSALVVESYKKAILVQLLHDGTKLKLPKYTPNIVLRLLPANSNHYTGSV